MKKKLYGFVVFFYFLGAIPATAAVPGEINYVGCLREFGQRVNGNRDITISVWDSLTGGAQLWTGPETTVAVSSGAFSISITPVFDFHNTPVYLQVKVSDKILEPREKISSSLYSLLSQVSEGLQKESGTIDVKIGGSTIFTISSTELDFGGRTLKNVIYEGEGSGITGVLAGDIAPSSVDTAKIKDEEIINADVNPAAGIATSKLSGPVMSIPSHGLGNAATKDVGTAAGTVAPGDDSRFTTLSDAATGLDATKYDKAGGEIANNATVSGVARHITTFFDTTAWAQSVGAGFLLGGFKNAAGEKAYYAAVWCEKATAVEGDTSGLIKMAVLNAAGNYETVLKLSETEITIYKTISDGTSNSTQWGTAYTERRQWDGGSTGLSVPTARTSLGLGDSATKNVGTVAGTVAPGDDSRFLSSAQKTDLTDAGDCASHYNASDRDLGNATGLAIHERGGLEKDVSAFNGLLKISGGVSSVVTDASANWNTAYTDRLKWDGGSTGLNATTGRASLGLNALAILSTVSGGAGGTIADDTITDDDVKPTAGIATTKLSGPVMSIPSHGLGNAATKDVGTAAGTVAPGDDSRFLSSAQKTDLTDAGDCISHYNASDRDLGNATGLAIHERGGLEKDVSAFNGLLKISGGVSSVVTDASANWNTAYTERRQWDGGNTNLNATTARASMDLGDSATKNVGTGAGSVCAGDDSRVTTAYADKDKWDGGSSGLNATTARASMGLAALAQLAAVSGGTGGTITDDTITNADVKDNAAIALNKLATGLCKIKIGSYSGDNVNGRQVTGVGFQPIFLIIYARRGDSNIYTVFKTSSDGLYSKRPGDGAWQDNIVTSLNPDGFTTGSQTGVANETGFTYTYIAFGTN